MSILDLFRSNAKADLDESVLVQLRKAGSDLSKPHNVEFFLYFPTKSIADEASVPIRSAGFEVDVKKAAEDDTWLCLATKEMVPHLPDLQRIRHDFVALASPMKGQYDGWGTQVVK
jgi:regulator of RNase E activity RraB